MLLIRFVTERVELGNRAGTHLLDDFIVYVSPCVICCYSCLFSLLSVCLWCCLSVCLSVAVVIPSCFVNSMLWRWLYIDCGCVVVTFCVLVVVHCH